MSVPALAKGANAPLSSSSVIVTVDLAAPADLSALLVTSTGKVRSDADFVFFNQPDGPGVQCRQAGGNWQIEVDTAAVPADIDQIRVVISLEGDGKTFASVAPPVAKVSDNAGNALMTYEVSGLSSELIVIALEIYRRNAEWKARAVGQGYAGGLAELISDHGVSVDDEPADAPLPPAMAAPAAPPPPPAATPATPASTPATPASTPPPALAGDQPFWSGAHTAPPPPPPTAGDPPFWASAQTQAPATNAPSWPPASPTFAPTGQPTGTPAQQFPPSQQFPPAQPAQAAPAEPTLTTGRPVSLVKGQRISLKKEGGVCLTQVRMGLGWDPVRGGRQIDLDASAILFSGTNMVDKVSYTQLRSRDGNIVHTGDNLTGRGDGDDEVIKVNLAALPPSVTTIIFIITSYQGQTFDKVANAHCRLVDDTTNQEMVRFTLGDKTPHRGMVMAKLVRDASGWQMQGIGVGIDAKTPAKAANLLVPFL